MQPVFGPVIGDGKQERRDIVGTQRVARRIGKRVTAGRLPGVIRNEWHISIIAAQHGIDYFIWMDTRGGMMKRIILFLFVSVGLPGLFGADAANDLILTQRKADNSGNIQRNLAPTARGFLTFDASKIPASTTDLTYTSPTLSVPDAFAISSAGSIALTAGGSNKNITLTPSGTGVVVATKDSSNNELQLTTTTSGYARYVSRGFSSSTTLASTNGSGADVQLQNQDTTANTFSAISNLDAGSSLTSRIAFVNVSDATNEGSIHFLTRPSGGSATDRLSIEGDGSLRFPSTNTAGLQLYNTSDQTTNYERLEALWTGNVATIRANVGGSGNVRVLRLTQAGGGIGSQLNFNTGGSVGWMQFAMDSATASTNSVAITGTQTATSGTNSCLRVAPTYNQASGTAANTDFLINRTETAVGSGAQYLIQAQVGSANRGLLTNNGDWYAEGRGKFGAASSGVARLTLTTGISTTAWGVQGITLRVDPSTYTDASTAGSGTAASAVFTSFAQPTLAATNTSVTTTNAATLYVANAPAAGTNMTLTNAWALWVDSGSVRLDGPIVGTPQALSGAGAVDITSLSTFVTSTGVGNALTLANGTAGQIKTIVHVVDGGSAVLTPTTALGYTTITFAVAGDSVTLQYTDQGWAVIGSRGVVIA